MGREASKMKQQKQQRGRHNKMGSQHQHQRKHHQSSLSSRSTKMHFTRLFASVHNLLFGAALLLLLTLASLSLAHAISIKPSDFDRLIMPCYLGGGGGTGSYQSYGQSQSYGGGVGGQPQYSMSAQSTGGGGSSMYSNGLGGTGGRLGQATNGYQAPSYYGSAAGARANGAGLGETSGGLGRSPNLDPAAGPSSYLGSSSVSSAAAAAFGQPSGSPMTPLSGYSGGLPSAGGQPRDLLSNNLGQTMPRANTIENFIALVNKIEVANPRLANNPDELIRALLSRFRLDNYYYDVRSRTPISEQDRRTSDILPALMATAGTGAAAYGGSAGGLSGMQAGEMLPEHSLDQDEKCSMYFMLSHFIDKTTPSNPSLGQMPLSQLAGPLNGQRPPSLQAAGAGYPGASANLAYNSAGGSGGNGGIGGTGGGALGGQSPRYPGPSPSFGSPQTANMNSFGAGISASNPELVNQRNPYGMNSPAQSAGAASMYNSALNNPQLRNPNAAFPAAPARAPYIDASATSARATALGGGGGGRSGTDDGRLAIEYGVVTTANQDNAALVLNRVLLGLLAAVTPPQTIRQIASLVYPMVTPTNTPKLDDEIDPLFAVTLADLWAVSSIPKAGKPMDFRLLGDNGRWNDAMCPTSFTLERSSSIRFTTAELLGGLDGFALGMFRRQLLQMRRNIRLSELLRIYYSKTGFRPQFPEIGVCNRQAALNTQLDDLHRQAENYLRLYQLALPTSDNDIALQISRLDGFREIARQAANNYAPQDICQESASQFDLYPLSGQDQCEISRTDVVLVLDVSQQANQPFEQLVAAKLAQRIGLSRGTNSFTIMTNQQDTSGYAGAYSFNTILRNSTNLGEIGCALTHDTSSGYQGGQVTDPTRLMEMFERALVNLDSEYLTRQLASGFSSSYSSSSSSSYNRQNSYVSTWFGGQGGMLNNGEQQQQQSYMYTPGGGQTGGPRNTGGAKIILWFNYGSQVRPSQIASGPTSWQNAGGSPVSSSSWISSSSDSQEYKFYEAKKYLRENFRGASILALSQSRDDVKSFVYDEDRDIFTDVASGNGGLSSMGGGGGDSYSSGSLSSSQQLQQAAADPANFAMLSGQADQLINKLLQRMCTIPAIFQYPMCFRVPSDGVASAGYISPGRKQYWMMSPKTFFASRSVRLLFKVEGGRLRVCFGRRPNPDETAAKYNQQNGIYDQQQQLRQPQITFQQANQASYQMNGANGGGSMQAPPSTTAPPTPSSSDYYTGLEYGVCKDLSPGQEVDFLISEPCYKKSIAECEPFYFVVRETSQPGEGDPNYMCREEGCKRFDQAKFVMTHTGVSCSAAFKGAQASWLLIMISTIAASILSLSSFHPPASPAASGHRPQNQATIGRKRTSPILFSKNSLIRLATLAPIVLYLAITQQVANAQQQAGVYDFGQNRYGEKRGNFTPSEVTAIILIIMLILGGLALTISLCYYVTKRARAGMQPVAQDGY